MARSVKTDDKSVKQYVVKVVTNPEFCGIGAGSVQFAHGQAIIPEGRMVEWFKEHNGYEVKEMKTAEAAPVAEE